MFAQNRVIDERGQAVAAAQVLFRSGSVGSCLAREFVFLIGTQLETQALDDALHDRVLHADDVAGFRVNPLAPENLAGADVEELCRDAESIAGPKESRSENCVNTELASRFSSVDGSVLILHDHG